MYLLERFLGGRENVLSAEWVNLTSSDRSVPAGGDEEVETIRPRLSAWITSLPRARSLRLEPYLFTTTPVLIDRLLSQYVERRDVGEAVQALMHESRSGNLWIIAGPGTGKSSVLAALVKRYQAVHHFISQYEGKNVQAAILRSLIAQLLMRISTKELPEESDERLPQQFANLLVRESMKANDADPTVIVVDAIDELGDEDAIMRFLRAFPDELPSGAYIIMSSRPLPQGVAMPKGATRFGLRPLSINDIRLVAQKHGLVSESRVYEQAFVASRGNPLFAVWALTILRENPNQDLTSGDGMENIMGPLLSGPMTSKMADDVMAVLAILASAQRPLDLSSISSATGLRRVQALAVINRLSVVLLVSAGEVSLGHQTVRDYLLDRRSLYGLDDAAVLKAHRSLATLAESGQTTYPSWLTSWHAVRVGEPEMVNRVLAREDGPEQLSRALAELAATDLTRVTRVIDALPVAAHSVAAETMTRLCEVRMATAASALFSMEWARSVSTLDRSILDLSLAIANEDVRLAIEIARKTYPVLKKAGATNSVMSRVAFLYGDGLRIQGHHEEAAKLYNEALQSAAPGSPDEFLASFQIADIDFVCGRLSKAEARLVELLRAARDHINVFGEIRVLREKGHLPLARHEWQEAAELYGDALDLALIAGRGRMIGECYISLAESLSTVDPDRSLENAAIGEKHAIAAGTPREAGKSYYVRAEAYLSLGRLVESLDAGNTALRMLTQSGYGSGIARARLAIARALFAEGRIEDALAVAREAYDYYNRERIYPQHWAAALQLLHNVTKERSQSDMASVLPAIEELPNAAEFPQLRRVSG
jgi:tetratricopeptide (TPR) repeat protein